MAAVDYIFLILVQCFKILYFTNRAKFLKYKSLKNSHLYTVHSCSHFSDLVRYEGVVERHQLLEAGLTVGVGSHYEGEKKAQAIEQSRIVADKHGHSTCGIKAMAVSQI